LAGNFLLFHRKFAPQATRIAPSTSTASTQCGVAEADLLELIVGEVVGLVMALGVPAEAVAAGLCEFLALVVCPILHGPAEIGGVALDAAQ
jgi:hypothetical protein